MQNLIIKTAVLTGILGLIGCAGGPEAGPDLSPEATRRTVAKVPDWFLNTPVEEGYRHETGTATSQDMQIAIDKAALNASNKLAGQMDSEMKAVVNRAQEETGLGAESDIVDRFSQTQEQIILNSLKDWRIAKKEIQEEKSGNTYIYRAYVLIEWDEGAANKRLLAQIKEDQQIYQALRATELLEEMEAKVEAYRKRKGM